MTKSGSGTWQLGGNNNYSGQTTINDGRGTLIFQNASQSVSAASKLWIGGSAGMTLLDDDSGTINLGNNVDVGVAGTGERDGPTIFVGNNNTANGGTSSGTTTGSTIALGTFNLTYGDARSTQILRIRGANGYRLQFGGLTLAKRADQQQPADRADHGAGHHRRTGDPGERQTRHGLDAFGHAGPHRHGDRQPDQRRHSGCRGLPKQPERQAAEHQEERHQRVDLHRRQHLHRHHHRQRRHPAGQQPRLAGPSQRGLRHRRHPRRHRHHRRLVTVAASANLAPGASAGTLSIGGNLDISALAGGAGKLNFELGAIGSSDQIAVTGGLDIGSGTLGLSDFNFTNLGGLQDGTYTLISSSGLTGSLDGGDVDDVGTIFPGATIQLQTSGNNIVLAVSGLGGGTAYETWATGNEPFDGDANGDGVKDGLAFLLGAANPSENAIGRLPTVTESGGGLVLTFNCLPIAARGTATLKVEHSNDLAIWTRPRTWCRMPTTPLRTTT